ncbi:unnamed protein product [Arctia plantaginis]|uniref:Uncharacterized protein n=1 Tax=Arctia plantaginis TaxID=874455 RepID=A0A8S1A3S9_ARCPL|nr:unnamed protein product [Arctia plantaginis]
MPLIIINQDALNQNVRLARGYRLPLQKLALISKYGTAANRHGTLIKSIESCKKTCPLSAPRLLTFQVSLQQFAVAPLCEWPLPTPF